MAFKADDLERYRGEDDRSEKGEVLPENETLNAVRLRAYLDNKGYTPGNFSERFRVVTALEILKQGGTKGGDAMIDTIKAGVQHLASIDKADLIEVTDKSAFQSTLSKELIRGKMTQLEAPIMQAYVAYHTVRNLAERSIKIQKEFQRMREAEKPGPEKTFQDSFNEVIGDVKKNFDHMSGKEKLFAVGGVILGGIFLFTSESPKVKWIKDKVTTLAKAGGVAFGANYIYKIFSGQTMLEAASDWSRDTVAEKKFFMETFKADEKSAEALSKSVIYLGDKNFIDIAKRYKNAQASGGNKIDIPGVEKKHMTPEEIFTALDVFFKKYPVDKLVKRFEKDENNPTWSTIVSGVMVEDDSIQMSENVVSQAVEGVKDISVKGWNGFWVTTEGFGLAKWMYLTVRGKEPTKAQLAEFEKSGEMGRIKEGLKNEVLTEADLSEKVTQLFSKESGIHFQEMLRNPEKSKNFPVIFKEVKDDAIYLSSESRIDMSLESPEQATQSMMDKAMQNAKDFIQERYPVDIGDHFHRYVDADQIKGITVVKDSSFRYFIRVPIPGSPQFHKKSVGFTPEREEVPHADIFVAGESIDGKEKGEAMTEWENERLKLAFALDSKQEKEILAIKLWYTNYFQGKEMSRKDAMKTMLEDEELRARAITETGIKQGLKSGIDLLAAKESAIVEVEKDAAAKFDTTWTTKFNPSNWLKKASDAYEPLMEQMRRNYGHKVRLAIMGDSASKEYFKKQLGDKLDPAKNDKWMDELLSEYKVKCEELVRHYSTGKLKLDAGVEHISKAAA